jgi:hypothetical protein
MKLGVLLAVAAVVCCVAATARATTQPSMLMHVKVTVSSTRIALSSNHTARGWEVEFRVENSTSARQRFSIGGKTILVPARAVRLTAISFQARGRYAVISRTARRRLTAVFRVQ